MSAYYNEHDPYAAQWLRNLIDAGHIAPGDVDERSIVDVRPDDLRGYTQCHWFAGIGGWSYALRLAGWPDDRPVWTGSCPCQPFSAAGAGKAADDERHLWPQWFSLIRECRPAIVVGEQVEAAIGWGWIDLVFSDLEAEGYACGAAVLPACSVGAPHIRQRLWFVGNAHGAGCPPRNGECLGNESRPEQSQDSGACGMADAMSARRPEGRLIAGHRPPASGGAVGFVADADGSGRRGWPTSEGWPLRDNAAGGGGRLGDAGCSGLPERERDGGVQQGTMGPSEGKAAVGGGDAGAWDDLVWLPCTDGKARPVEPKYVKIPDGLSGGMADLCAGSEKENLNGEKSQTRSDQTLHGVWSITDAKDIQKRAGEHGKFHSAEILRSALHGNGTGRTDQDTQRTQQPETIGKDGQELLRDMRPEQEPPACSSPRPQSAEQFERQFADFVRFLPSSLALAKLSGDAETEKGLLVLLKTCGAEGLVQHPSYEIETLWRSLDEESQVRLRMGFATGGWMRSHVSPLATGIPNRVGQLRAYGNAIVPQVAAEFIKAVT